MAKFADIIGQEQLKEHIQNAITSNKVSHAYIINGERNAGKEFIARIFAMTLQCEKGGTEPCNECHSCKQTRSHNQPDIVYISHEKPNSIGVEDIRGQINNDIGIKPYSSPRKIYIMNEGEKMTPQAQNALLKTLEEPPEYAVIMILTDNVEALLPTIISRCVVLHMKPVSDKLVKQYLMEELGVPDYKANICVAFARGNIGKAKLLASSEEFEKVKDEAITLVKYINDMEIHEIVKAIKKIMEYKLDVNDYLDILTVWYRDVLLFKATKDMNSLVFKNEIQQIRRVADRSTYEGIETIVSALQQAKRRLEANVNFDLTMELMLLTIKEN
ncbi:MAG: DNA polymerase III subunit [Lachnospiraceae bacterium]|jgi:DNA polymerase-3 subunit delta'|nr:DNA polymerase III subunit [Lachnospiraceae bacterium]